MSEQNKALIRRWIEEVQKGNVDVTDKVLAPRLRRPQPASRPIVHRIVGGKVKEEWSASDTLGMLRQLEAAPER